MTPAEIDAALRMGPDAEPASLSPDEQLEIPWIRDARFARRPTGTYGKEAAHDTER